MDHSSKTKILKQLARTSGEIAESALEKLCTLAVDQLENFHQREPDAAGQPLEAFRTILANHAPGPVAEYAIRRLVKSRDIEIDANIVRLSSFDSRSGMSAQERELMDSIESVFRDGGVSTPSLDEVIGSDQSRKVAYQHLKEQGKLVTVTNASSRKQFVFHADTIDRIKRDLVREFPAPKKFTVSDIRTLLDSSRKYVVPLLEHFDKNRLTIRQGDFRVVTSALAHQNRALETNKMV